MRILEQTKPQGMCKLDGCFTYVKNKRRKFCSKECSIKSKGAKIPKCENKNCNKKVKRNRNHYCSWKCYRICTDKHAHDTCQHAGCNNPLTSRKSTRKYCSQECYKLDHPNRPSRKKVRICTLPGCKNQIKRRGANKKYCSVACSVISRKTLVSTICPTCEKNFQPLRQKQIFCSNICRREEKKVKIKILDNLPRRFTRVVFQKMNISNVKSKWILTANATWEEHNGEVSNDKKIWFKDGNCFNDMDINNLYLVDRKEYLELIKEVAQPDKETLKSGNYEGRIEKDNNKQEFFDHKQEFF